MKGENLLIGAYYLAILTTAIALVIIILVNVTP
jgi:hypothetical protein